MQPASARISTAINGAIDIGIEPFLRNPLDRQKRGTAGNETSASEQVHDPLHSLSVCHALFCALSNRAANRRLLQDRLGHALATTSRNGLYGAILFLDLDNFKTLNDTRGHDVGDLLLVECAPACVKATRWLARRPPMQSGGPRGLASMPTGVSALMATR